MQDRLRQLLDELRIWPLLLARVLPLRLWRQAEEVVDLNPFSAFDPLAVEAHLPGPEPLLLRTKANVRRQ